ncbi:MAG: Probable endoglucanase, partial [uncultured Rubrobacteraceae bacterium]
HRHGPRLLPEPLHALAERDGRLGGRGELRPCDLRLHQGTRRQHGLRPL